MSDVGFVYALCDPATGDVRYVGQTRKTPRQRWRGHVATAQLQKTTTPRRMMRVTRWIIGLDEPPLLTVLEDGVPVDDLNDREKYWIAEMISRGCDLVNSTHGGGGNGGAGGWPKGLKPTPEQAARRLAWTNTHEGQTILAENGRRSGEMLRGRQTSDETRARISKTLSGKKRKPLSEETRRKISEARRGKRTHRNDCDCSFCTDPARGAMIRWHGGENVA